MNNIERKLNAVWKALRTNDKTLRGYIEAFKQANKEQSEKLDKLIDTVENKEYTVKSSVSFDTKTLEEKLDASFKQTLKVEVENQPEPVKEVSITNLPEPVTEVSLDKKTVKAIEKSISKIDVKPELTVESKEVEVNVEKQFSDDPTEFMPVQMTDGKKFVNINKRFDDVVTAIKQMGAGVVVSNSSGEEDPTSVYKPSDADKNDGATSYYGFLTASGSWYIMSVNSDSTEFRYTRGSNNYTTNWTNRASLTYNYFDIIF